MKPRGSALGTIVVALAILVTAWLGLRRMNDAQLRAYEQKPDGAAPQAAPVSSGKQLVPQIPPQIVSAAGKTPLSRLDVTVRVDGLDLTLDGAQACREGSKRLVGRDGSGAIGSFDEKALLTCVTLIRASRPEAKLVAMVGRAGPAVPSTYVDALVAALKRGGIGDVVVTP